METPLTPLDFARRARKLYGEREAVVDGNLRLTYAQFYDRNDRRTARKSAANYHQRRLPALHRACERGAQSRAESAEFPSNRLLILRRSRECNNALIADATSSDTFSAPKLCR